MTNFWKNLSTGKDNQTHDVVRVAVIVITIYWIISIMVGSLLYCVSWVVTITHPEVKLFDFMTFSNSNGIAIGAFTGFIMGSGGALFFKKTTEPDGSQTTIESIKSGPGSAEPEINVTKQTNVNLPGSNTINP